METLTKKQTRPLARMVEEANGRGTSFREMATRARSMGHAISFQQLQNYSTDSVTKAPDAAMIDALAAALDVPRERVQAAVFEQWYGYTPHTLEEGAGMLLPPDLTQEERDAVEQMVRAFLSMRRPADPE